jgi:hypothetical protein
VYVTHARFGFVGSTTMPETKRPGAAAEVLSIRVNDTVLGSAAFAFFETKTRPVAVAAHSV